MLCLWIDYEACELTGITLSMLYTGLHVQVIQVMECFGRELCFMAGWRVAMLPKAEVVFAGALHIEGSLIGNNKSWYSDRQVDCEVVGCLNQEMVVGGETMGRARLKKQERRECF